MGISRWWYKDSLCLYQCYMQTAQDLRPSAPAPESPASSPSQNTFLAGEVRAAGLQIIQGFRISARGTTIVFLQITEILFLQAFYKKMHWKMPPARSALVGSTFRQITFRAGPVLLWVFCLRT